MVQRKLGYKFKNPALLETALTHSSYANEFSCQSNERLEFLGDSLLGFIVSLVLYEKYPSFSEGALTKIKSRVVSGANFAKYAEHLGLRKSMRLGKGEEKTGGRKRESNNADAFEALVGALYFDAGYEETFNIVSKLVDEAVSEDVFPGDAKTELQEIVLKTFGTTPEYRVLSERGPLHKRIFTVEVVIPSGLTGKGEAASKKRAGQLAAKDILLKLGDRT